MCGSPAQKTHTHTQTEDMACDANWILQSKFAGNQFHISHFNKYSKQPRPKVTSAGPEFAVCRLHLQPMQMRGERSANEMGTKEGGGEKSRRIEWCPWRQRHDFHIHIYYKLRTCKQPIVPARSDGNSAHFGCICWHKKGTLPTYASSSEIFACLCNSVWYIARRQSRCTEKGKKKTPLPLAVIGN